MPAATTPKNVEINGSLSTFRRITASGNDSAMTDIMNASAVPCDLGAEAGAAQ